MSGFVVLIYLVGKWLKEMDRMEDGVIEDLDQLCTVALLQKYLLLLLPNPQPLISIQTNPN